MVKVKNAYDLKNFVDKILQPKKSEKMDLFIIKVKLIFIKYFHCNEI